MFIFAIWGCSGASFVWLTMMCEFVFCLLVDLNGGLCSFLQFNV